MNLGVKMLRLHHPVMKVRLSKHLRRPLRAATGLSATALPKTFWRRSRDAHRGFSKIWSWTFVGSLEGHHAQKGVFITTSRFSQDARDFLGRIGKKIILVDGQMLAQLMIDYNIGVSETRRYVLKKINSDYFNEE
jgi:hypothetical protein